MDKNAIKKYAIWARRELIARVSQKAEQYGITEKEIIDERAESVHGAVLSPAQVRQRQALIQLIKKDGYQQAMEEVAYTWFNRFIALRFMEVNDYLPGHTRAFTDDQNAFKPRILSDALELDLNGLDIDRVIAMKEANDTEGLYRHLLITLCNHLSDILPGMFQRIDDYTELLFPEHLLREGSVIEQMVRTIAEEEWTDQIQIIGWLYQYYNSELKDKAFEELKTAGTIRKENIPAATQLFTPDWMVRYMVENSLGRYWMMGHPTDNVRNHWKHYLRDTKQDDKCNRGISIVQDNSSCKAPVDLLCIDPCAGSGHIICYLFDVLYQIYTANGYSTREAVSEIVEKNIWGLDIDDRAVQLAYFSVMMKARQYDRRFFAHPKMPNVYCIQESNAIDKDAIDYYCGSSSMVRREAQKLFDLLIDAKEYGSLLDASEIDFSVLFERNEELKKENSLYSQDVEKTILPAISAAYALSKKYDIVCTNPPYMGNKGFTPELLKFITKNYPEGKIDLYAAFILRCEKMTKSGSLYSMVTPESWMFLSRFEKLRRPFLENNTFATMLHLGFNAFDSGFGTVAFSAITENIDHYKATCYRLVDYNSSEEKENAIFTDAPFFSSKLAYQMVDGSPICYWVSEAMLRNFDYSKVKDNGKTCVGLLTGNNDRFLRFWYEISFELLGIGYTHEQAKVDPQKKWYPINQYGEYRKWYGNNLIVFDWWNDGFNIKKFKMDRYLAGEAEKKNSMCWNEDTYFMSGVTWNRISTNKFSARMSPEGNTAGSSSPIYFPKKREYYLLALFNSCVFSSIVAFLNPTVSFQTADIEKVPVIFGSEEIDTLARENVELAKQDWDSFETSYEFKKHPLV